MTQTRDVNQKRRTAQHRTGMKRTCKIDCTSLVDAAVVYTIAVFPDGRLEYFVQKDNTAHAIEGTVHVSTLMGKIQELHAVRNSDA